MKARIACGSIVKTGKVVRLEKLALQQREPDLDLIKPRGIGGQPIQLYGQFPLRCRHQFLSKAGELLGRMGWAIVEDQSDGLHSTAPSFWNDNGL